MQDRPSTYEEYVHHCEEMEDVPRKECAAFYAEYDPRGEEGDMAAYRGKRRFFALVPHHVRVRYDREGRIRRFRESMDPVRDQVRSVVLGSDGPRLIMTPYKHREGNYWGYTKGRIIGPEGVVLHTVHRNYGSFPVAVGPGGRWVVCGEDYQGYTVLDLHEADRRADFFPPAGHVGHGFCPMSWDFSPCGRWLAVYGCYWSAPGGVRVYAMPPDPVEFMTGGPGEDVLPLPQVSPMSLECPDGGEPERIEWISEPEGMSRCLIQQMGEWSLLHGKWGLELTREEEDEAEEETDKEGVAYSDVWEDRVKSTIEIGLSEVDALISSRFEELEELRERYVDELGRSEEDDPMTFLQLDLNEASLRKFEQERGGWGED